MSREDEVLEAMKWVHVGATPTIIARALNLYRGYKVKGNTVISTPCAWCPVLPPKLNEHCAVVPSASRQRVARVMNKLLEKGLITAEQWRYRMFFVPSKD